MGISKVIIRNFKSLENIDFDLEKSTYNIQCFLGENGTGKSNFIDAISYFYSNLQSDDMGSQVVFDKRNPYSQKVIIEITYDFSSFNYNGNSYIEDRLGQLEDHIVDNKLQIRLTQYKNRRIVWSIKEGEVRKFLAKIFPIILLDVRFISLQEWSALWDIISDFSISTVKIPEKKIQDSLDDIFVQIYGEKYLKVISRITQIFNDEKITINDREFKTRFKNALFTRLGGGEFLSEGNNLPFYSDGLNSLKYIKLLLGMVNSLVDTGWKDPLILLDEPELGLHPQYINELAEVIQKSANVKVNIIVATHSTYLVSLLIKNKVNTAINRIYMKNGYSKIERLKDIIDDKDKFLITAREAESYFAKMLILVEGMTEIHVFKNKWILKLFPKLIQVNIYNYDSNNKVLKIIHPNTMNFKVPYLIIDDMDKILYYHKKSKRMKLKRGEVVNPLFDRNIIKKQKFYYYKEKGKKFYTYNLQQRIGGMLNLKFDFDILSVSISNGMFERLIDATKRYCIEYNIVPWKTTIEGCLINENTVNIAVVLLFSWIQDEQIGKLSKLLDKYKDSFESQLAIIRVIFNGKFDCLYTLKEAKENKILESTDYSFIKNMQDEIGGKTDGWIGEFMSFYFEHILENYTQEEKRKRFSEDFSEIYYVLQIVDHVII